MLSFLRHPQPANRASTHGAMSVAWIDGVGCFWISLKDRLTIGGPSSPSATADDSRGSSDIAILSDLKRQHATIVLSGEGYLLESNGSVRVAGRDVVDRAALSDGTIIELGRSVRLRFRLPSALSLSARLDFVSDHRPAQAVDGIVLLADTCLLGPTDENHIVCSDWPGQVLLVRQGDELLCRSRMDLSINGHRVSRGKKLSSGDVVTADELRFRIETRS